MSAHRVHGVVVDGVQRDEQGNEQLVWGVVSDLDLVGALHAEGEEPTAGRMAGSPAVVVAPDDLLIDAARIMSESDVHHLVVVGQDDRRPVGILSTLDVAGAIAETRG
jgi:CBS domain-containing protein